MGDSGERSRDASGLKSYDTTRQLARFLVESHWDDIPQAVRHEAKRALLNWLGCSLGGCRDEAVDRVLSALHEFSGPRHATIIGRIDKLDVLNAALVNAISSNILDFDDTHLKTVIHPTVPVAAAICALAEYRAVTGAELIHALVLGIEAECRIGYAVSPGHYASGWHITSTCGVFGAAAAAGKLLHLNEQQMAWALSIAATQSSGLTEMLGSMSKSLNMGFASRNGLMAAFLAASGFTSSERGIEATRGFANVLARDADLERVTDRLGETWELSGNAYKPFPCGIVLHPVIDGCIQLRNERQIDPGQIERIDLRVHPLVLELTGKKDPLTGLEGKLSVYHAAAVAMVQGVAGVKQFSDACVRDPTVRILSGKVESQIDSTLNKVEAYIKVVLKDGRSFAKHIQHAIGTLERPMSDSDLEHKFTDLSANSLSRRSPSEVIKLAWRLDELKDAASLVRITVPTGTTVLATL